MINKGFLRQATLAFLLFITPLSLLADRGMWLPFLLNEIEGEMQEAGLKLSAEDIYSINKSSLKDAVVRFGGGCTAEIISDQGLLLTNHHCGYYQINSHSTVENNRLEDGYWAKNNAEELPCPGLTVTFIVKMEDVTDQILDGLESASADEKGAKIQDRIAAVIEKATKGTNYEAKISPYYYGLEYYMTVTETYKDVRLVGTPPEAVGKFGGDTDNWMWPRHTGDFSVFRIYADKNNNSAEYSADNVPYKPKHHFPVNIGGVKEGDFTMVFGFPGRTQQYLPSIAVQQLTNFINPPRIDIRAKKLKVLDKFVKNDPAVRLMYASRYARIANYHKKWIGETRGLKQSDAYGKKLEYEGKMTEWLRTQPEEYQAQYAGLFSNMESLYKEKTPLQQASDVLNEAGFAIQFADMAWRLRELLSLEDEGAIKEKKEQLAAGFAKRYDQMNLELEQVLFDATLKLIVKEQRNIFLQDWVLYIKEQSDNNITEYGKTIFRKSLFANKEDMIGFIEKYNPKKKSKLEKDPYYGFFNAMITNHVDNVRPRIDASNEKIEAAMKLFMKAQREYEKDRRFFPDANSTLRLTYGKVEPYTAFSGTEHSPFTTLDGLIAKENPKNREFHVPAKLKELWEAKDYGAYALDGTVPVCFIASNHTTGGNSGSPLLNANGELVGINFDRNWEGTMSDVNYDVSQVRNISTDIRYILFIMDKLGGAKHLVEEMTVIGG